MLTQDGVVPLLLGHRCQNSHTRSLTMALVDSGFRIVQIVECPNILFAHVPS